MVCKWVSVNMCVWAWIHSHWFSSTWSPSPLRLSACSWHYKYPEHINVISQYRSPEIGSFLLISVSLPLSLCCSRNELTSEYSILFGQGIVSPFHSWHLCPTFWVLQEWIYFIGLFRSLRLCNAKPLDELSFSVSSDSVLLSSSISTYFFFWVSSLLREKRVSNSVLDALPRQECPGFITCLTFLPIIGDSLLNSSAHSAQGFWGKRSFQGGIWKNQKCIDLSERKRALCKRPGSMLCMYFMCRWKNWSVICMNMSNSIWHGCHN